MAEMIVDEPGTLRGRLQRGRGAAARAVERDPAAARDLVLRCVVEDPRWANQFEERSLYFASLLRDGGWPLDALAAHLFDAADHVDTDEWRTGLALGVLGDLARGGHQAARDLLRRYVVEGWNWEWALRDLAGCADPEATEGLVEPLLARLGPDALDVAVEDCPPWTVWARTHTGIRDALERRAAVSARRERERDPEPDWPTQSAAQLADLVRDGRWARRAGQELGRRADPALFELAAETLSLAGRIGVSQGLRAFPDDDELRARARSWYAPGHPGRDRAVGILAARGTAADAPVLLDELAAAVADARWDSLCDIADGVGRLRLRPAEPLLLRAWDESEYSYARSHVLPALVHIGSPAVAAIATEGLWDCESAVRRGALPHARSADDVRRRIRQLAADPLEDTDVRAAAARI